MKSRAGLESLTSRLWVSVCTSTPPPSHGGLLGDLGTYSQLVGVPVGTYSCVMREGDGTTARRVYMEDMEQSLMILHVHLESNCSFGVQKTIRNDL